MPRQSAFTFATFDVHVQPSLRRAFPMAYETSSRTFELLLSERLAALKRLFDDEASRDQAAAA